jgi:hypothetical protein
MLDDLLLAKLAAVEGRSEELSAKLSDPEVSGTSAGHAEAGQGTRGYSRVG